jgi:hypothetical protein
MMRGNVPKSWQIVNGRLWNDSMSQNQKWSYWEAYNLGIGAISQKKFARPSVILMTLF